MANGRVILGRLAGLRPWGIGRARHVEPGAALFRGIRLRLTLWYSGVLAVALIASGLVLYFGLQDLTLSPVKEYLRAQADFHEREWLRTPPHICGQPGGRPPPPARFQATLPVYVACFDLEGNLLNSMALPPGGASTPPEAFLQSPLLAKTLQDGTSDDVIDAGDDLGPVYRVAIIVRDPGFGSPLGVVQVGRSIAALADTLQLVRSLLLFLAVLATLGAMAGGLFLANRALEPARWAFVRQQAFIADASHQLRTPLTVLRASADVLLRHRDRFDPADAELLEDIVGETVHMDRLSTNLLALARLDAGRPHLEYEVIDLAALATGIVRRVSMLAAEKNLTLREEYGDGAVLVGDQHAVEQAALILVENAIKYTPHGGTVTLRTMTADGHVSLVVEDTGVGVPPEYQRRLGQRFYRGDPEQSRETEGAGLGLAIASGIAEAHGGSVRIANTGPRGARATLTLAVGGPKR